MARTLRVCLFALALALLFGSSVGEYHYEDLPLYHYEDNLAAPLNNGWEYGCSMKVSNTIESVNPTLAGMFLFECSNPLTCQPTPNTDLNVLDICSEYGDYACCDTSQATYLNGTMAVQTLLFGRCPPCIV